MIYLGSDHGGFQLKEKIKDWLGEWGVEFQDLGAAQFNPDDDYPQYAFMVAEAVGKSDDPSLAWRERDKGILACRSAAGMVMAANKIKQIRAASAYDLTSAKHSRQHNDANILALSGDWLSDDQAKQILETWLNTEFSKEDRHGRRIAQILEKEKML